MHNATWNTDGTVVCPDCKKTFATKMGFAIHNVSGCTHKAM